LGGAILENKNISEGHFEVARRVAQVVDTHAHLDDPKLAAREEEVLRRAREAGVAAVLTVGADLASSRQAVAIAGRRSEVFAAVGVHPHDARSVGEADWGELERLARCEKVVAVGECGLDFYRDLSPRPTQREVFARHLALAAQFGLPVIIHCRDAYRECFEIVRSECEPPLRGVLHCFQGDDRAASAALDLGLLIGLGGSITFPREEALRRVVATLPLERLVVETDAPYLTPRPRRGRNEPAYVVHTAARLAEILGAEAQMVFEQTTRNAARLFGLPLAAR